MIAIVTRRRFMLFALVFGLWTASASAQRLTNDYEAAAGVPSPTFGIDQRARAATYFVNSADPNATDRGNEQGSADRPRQTIPTKVPAGAVVEIRGGPYNVGTTSWTGSGSAGQPVYFRGVGDPIVNGRELTIAGSYVIVEGLVFDGIPLIFADTSSYIVLRDSIVRNWSPNVNSTGILPLGSYQLIYRNEIHNNGDPDNDSERDIHGIKPIAGAHHIWILNNNIHHNGGDGIQIGNATSPEPWPRYIYIARNIIHQDRENAVDIKKARDVIVSTNLMFGYQARSSSDGEIIVTHNNAQRIWIINNAAGSAPQGIVCTGAEGYVVLGNVVTNIQHHPNYRAYDPRSLFRGSAAILTYNTSGSAHVNNTIWNSDGGISYAGGTAPTEIVNNIVGPLTQPSLDIALGTSKAVGPSRVGNNLIAGDPRVNWGGTIGACPSRGVCFKGDPQLVENNKDFHLQAGSAAIDAGTTSAVFDAFKRLYGLAIDVDLYGTARPQGSGLDIGAAEFSQGKPSAPSRPRVVR